MIMQPLIAGGGGGGSAKSAAGDFSSASGTSFKITTGFRPTSLTIASSSVNYSGGSRSFMYSYNNGTTYVDYSGPSNYFTVTLNDDGFTITSPYAITSMNGGYTACK